MIQLELITHSPEETQGIGQRLGELAGPGDVFLLMGNLGAGKTCLTQGIARGLAIQDYASSPSFVIMRELYGRLPLYHIDLYRLERLEEISDLGLDEYLYGRGVSVVEWADRGLVLLPEEHLLIKMGFMGDIKRRLRLTASGRRYEQLLARLKLDCSE
jgi:tRNA threonylcarbamoyladenosine biosynthesis protein TsaE